MHMGASRLVNLQRHRIAQCRSIVIRILGDEGVPVQVDGEAWLHPPGIIRILHKNRVQLVCRDKVIYYNINLQSEYNTFLNRLWSNN
jgi:diacylglycerol kinase (ATP)